MTYAIQRHGVPATRRGDRSDTTAQARMTSQLGDMADRVSLAIHRRSTGRDWKEYAAAVDHAYEVLSQAVDVIDASKHTQVSFAGARALKFISRYGAAPDRPSDSTGESTREVEVNENTVTTLGDIRDELGRLIDGSIEFAGLQLLSIFFNTLADATLSAGQEVSDR